MFSIFSLLAMLACTSFYYHMGETEKGSGFLWGAISLLLWFAPAFFLHWGMLGCLVVQLGLFIALTIWNVITKKSLN